MLREKIQNAKLNKAPLCKGSSRQSRVRDCLRSGLSRRQPLPRSPSTTSGPPPSRREAFGRFVNRPYGLPSPSVTRVTCDTSRLRTRTSRGKTIINRFLTLSVSLRYPKGEPYFILHFAFCILHFAF